MIRAASILDVPCIVSMGAQMHAASPRLSGQTFDADKVEEIVCRLVESDYGCAFVSEIGNEITGFFLGLINETWFGHDLIAQDLALYVAPSKRGYGQASSLVDAYIEWARAKGAKPEIGISAGGAVDKIERFYELKGFKAFGPMMAYEGD